MLHLLRPLSSFVIHRSITPLAPLILEIARGIYARETKMYYGPFEARGSEKTNRAGGLCELELDKPTGLFSLLLRITRGQETERDFRQPFLFLFILEHAILDVPPGRLGLSFLLRDLIPRLPGLELSAWRYTTGKTRVLPSLMVAVVLFDSIVVGCHQISYLCRPTEENTQMGNI